MTTKIYPIGMKHIPRFYFLCTVVFVEQANSLKVPEAVTLVSYSESQVVSTSALVTQGRGTLSTLSPIVRGSLGRKIFILPDSV